MGIPYIWYIAFTEWSASWLYERSKVAITIALLNMKGGVGKTTLAVNLAWHMHQNEPANVLLVDLDPQFNATQYVMDYKSFYYARKLLRTRVLFPWNMRLCKYMCKV